MLYSPIAGKGEIITLCPSMTLPDGTEIVHSENIIKDGKEMVKVAVERPVDFGVKSAVCWLPDYRWERVVYTC